MNELIECLDAVFSARGSDISIAVIVAFQISVYWRHHSKKSYVKFPTFVKSWILNILLEDKCSFFICSSRIDYPSDVFKFSLHSNSYPSICVLTWLHNPYILQPSRFLYLIQLFLYLSLFFLILFKFLIQLIHLFVHLLLIWMNLRKDLFVYYNVFVFWI